VRVTNTVEYKKEVEIASTAHFLMHGGKKKERLHETCLNIVGVNRKDVDEVGNQRRKGFDQCLQWRTRETILERKKDRTGTGSESKRKVTRTMETLGTFRELFRGENVQGGVAADAYQVGSNWSRFSRSKVLP